MLLSIPVTLRTVIAVVAILTLVLVIHLVLRVAGGTRPRCRIAARMTLRTIPIRIFVADWECMIKRCALKTVCVMTI